ncbi:MAG: GDP-mannose 4,6-dehydratase [Spirochaetales bacterium]|nr:GDP-mannose 4,6-dehydratase [Spirochaetales bacterium]
MKTYLITGAAGFIGSRLAKSLLDAGNSVINVDNFNSYYSSDIKINNVLESVGLNIQVDLKSLKSVVDSSNYTLEVVDIRDFDNMHRVFSNNKIDCIIHLAAMAGVRPSIEDPMLYQDVNIKGTMNILELSREFNVSKFIMASSSSVYGNNTKVPFCETDVVDFAISPYAATKKACEVIGHSYHHLYNIDMIMLRFFTVYGPGQRPDLAIHKFTKMIDEGTPIPFFGDGSTKRDYTYVTDIVNGIVKSIDYVENNQSVYEIFNLGESDTISLTRMVSTIENALGKKAIINKMPMQPGDVNITYANVNKAKSVLGYNPSMDFEEGIKNFVDWYRRNK